MKKKVIILIFLVGLIWGGIILLKANNEYHNTDSYRFNEEYNLLLNTRVKYINANNLDNILNKDRAVIYIGTSKNEICHKVVPLLNEAVNKYNFNNFYYLNIDEEKPIFDIKDNEVIKVKDGSENYYKLIDLLDPFLKEYVIKKDNKEYKTGEKEIGLPFIIFIKDGKLQNYHEGTINQLDFDDKNSEQRLRLINIYSDLIVELL